MLLSFTWGEGYESLLIVLLAVELAVESLLLLILGVALTGWKLAVITLIHSIIDRGTIGQIIASIQLWNPSRVENLIIILGSIEPRNISIIIVIQPRDTGITQNRIIGSNTGTTHSRIISWGCGIKSCIGYCIISIVGTDCNRSISACCIIIYIIGWLACCIICGRVCSRCYRTIGCSSSWCSWFGYCVIILCCGLLGIV